MAVMDMVVTYIFHPYKLDVNKFHAAADVKLTDARTSNTEMKNWEFSGCNLSPKKSILPHFLTQYGERYYLCLDHLPPPRHYKFTDKRKACHYIHGCSRSPLMLILRGLLISTPEDPSSTGAIWLP
jgi:hypothetical protein